MTNFSIDSSSAIFTGQNLKLNGTLININGTVQLTSPGSQLVSRNRDLLPIQYSQLVIIAQQKFTLMQSQDPSKQVSVQTDYLFIYSPGDVVISGAIMPLALKNTCTVNEASEVFSFVQSQV